MINEFDKKQLYIVKFSNGLVKVGVGSNADKRIRQHEIKVFREDGSKIESSWKSIKHINYNQNENLIINMTQKNRVEHTHEWSRGCDFESLVKYAESFEYRVKLTKEEVDRTEKFYDTLMGATRSIKEVESKPHYFYECIGMASILQGMFVSNLISCVYFEKMDGGPYSFIEVGYASYLYSINNGISECSDLIIEIINAQSRGDGKEESRILSDVIDKCHKAIDSIPTISK